MGRPKLKEPKKQCTVYISQADAKKIQLLADKVTKISGKPMPFSQMTSNLVSMGLDDAVMLDKSGALSLILTAGKLANKLKLNILTGKMFVNEDGELEVKE